MLPNFMIIGAMKSGTTSLWRYLDSHPDAFLCYPKEPAFFVEELNWSRGWDWYESLFEAAGGAKAVGEASTYYTKLGEHEGVAERIHRHLPDLKLIYLMRNPVDRTISHYWHAVRFDHETRPPEIAIERDRRYVEFGRYAMQLAPYVERFGIERILPLTFERLVASPEAVLGEVCEFLEIDPTAPLSDLDKKHNAAEASVRRTNRLLHRIRWSKWWTAVAPYAPNAIKDWGKRHEFSSVQRQAVDESAARLKLQKIYADENWRLFEMLGARYDEWLTPAVSIHETANSLGSA